MIDPQRLLSLEVIHRRRYTQAESRLYALSIGFGADPMDTAELYFVGGADRCEAVPSMATVFGDVIMELTAACRLSRPELALHLEQRLELFSPLAAEDEVDITGRVSAVYDRGEKGAILEMTAEGRRATDGSALYRAVYVTLARGDGSFGGPPPSRGGQTSTPPPVPESPQQTWRYRTRPDQALLYSLNGDANPIHLDPSIARRAGFARPILHGLCTFGIACRGLITTVCQQDPSRLRRMDARFSAPVVPGDTLAVDLWQVGEAVRFSARAEERGVEVLKGGHASLGERQRAGVVLMETVGR